MEFADPSVRAEAAMRVARSGVDWLVEGHVGELDDPSLYNGRAGIVLALHEAAEQLGDLRRWVHS